MFYTAASSVAKNAATTCWHAMQVKLLQFVRPQDFDNFRHFVRWRDTTANILLQILQRAAQQPASDDDRCASPSVFAAWPVCSLSSAYCTASCCCCFASAASRTFDLTACVCSVLLLLLDDRVSFHDGCSQCLFQSVMIVRLHAVYSLHTHDVLPVGAASIKSTGRTMGTAAASTVTSTILRHVSVS